MNERETLFALIKGYSALASLVMPKAFLTGGWGISSLMLATSSIITTVCCCKLIDCGMYLNVYSYAAVVNEVLGKKGKISLDIFIALTQWSFVVSFITFLYTTFKGTVDTVIGIETSPVIYIVMFTLILTPMAWVRNIAKFSFTYFLGVIFVFSTVIVVTCYAVNMMVDQGGKGPDVMFFDQAGYLSTMGMCIYCYEGIGVVMPIM